MGLEALQHKLDVLKAHCDDVQRPFSEIELTTLGNVIPGQDSASEIIAKLQTLHKLGFTHVILNTPQVYELDVLKTLANQVIPVVAGW